MDFSFGVSKTNVWRLENQKQDQRCLVTSLSFVLPCFPRPTPHPNVLLGLPLNLDWRSPPTSCQWVDNPLNFSSSCGCYSTFVTGILGRSTRQGMNDWAIPEFVFHKFTPTSNIEGEQGLQLLSSEFWHHPKWMYDILVSEWSFHESKESSRVLQVRPKFKFKCGDVVKS